MKKILLGLGVVALSATLFACNGKDANLNDAYDWKEEIANASKLTADTAVEIDFWHTMGDSNQAWLNERIAEFNVTYPKIKVNHFAQGGYPDINKNIKTAISADTYPDFAIAYPDHVADYLGDDYDASVVFNISALMKDEDFGINTEDYVSSYLKEGLSYGTESYYSMPFSKSSEALFYNKTFFDANSLTPPKTWAEFETLAAKIKEIDSAKTVLAYDSDSNAFINGANQHGYKYTDASSDEKYLFNNDDTKSLVTKWKSWVEKGWYTSQALNDGAYNSTKFIAEELAMTIGSTGGTTYNIPNDGKFEVGVSAVPQISEDMSKGKVMNQGPSIVFFEDKDKDLTKTLASWEFYKFLTNADNSASYALNSTGYSPVNAKSYENAEYKAFLAKADSEFENTTAGNKAKALRDVAKLVADTYVKNDMFASSDVFRGSSAARAQIDILMLNALSGKMTVEDAFKNAYSTLTFK